MSYFPYPAQTIDVAKQNIIEKADYVPDSGPDSKIVIVGSTTGISTGDYIFHIDSATEQIFYANKRTDDLVKSGKKVSMKAGMPLFQFGKILAISSKNGSSFHLTQSDNDDGFPTLDGCQGASGIFGNYILGFCDDYKPNVPFVVNSGIFTLGEYVNPATVFVTENAGGCFHKDVIDARNGCLGILSGAQVYGKIYLGNSSGGAYVCSLYISPVSYSVISIGAEFVIPNDICRIQWYSDDRITLTYSGGRQLVKGSQFGNVPYLTDTFFSGGGSSANLILENCTPYTDAFKKFLNIALASRSKGTYVGNITTIDEDGKVTKY